MSPKLLRQRESRVGKGRWLLIGVLGGESYSWCCFLGFDGSVCNVFLRCIAHYPRQRDLFLPRDFFESFVEIRREADRCADSGCALGLHASSLSPFPLHRGLPV